MLFYFGDNNLNIIFSASTDDKTTGYKIVDDKTTSSLETGSDILECSIYANGNNTDVLKGLECGTFILKEKSFNMAVYDIFQVITAEYDVASKTLEIYSESAGVELLNTQVGPFTYPYTQTIKGVATVFMPYGWTIYNDNIGNSRKKLSWDGDSTLTERLLSIANAWNARIYFTFNVLNGEVTEKALHFKKDSNDDVVEILKLHDEISNIRISKSIMDLATCLIPTGASPETVDNNTVEPPINLVGYSYTYTDEKGDVYSVDTATGRLINTTQVGRHKSVFDPDGLIMRPYSFDTLSQEMLAGQARAALQKISYPQTTYNIEIDHLDKPVDIGDIVMILADEDDVHIRARVTKMTSSYTANRITADVEVVQ